MPRAFLIKAKKDKKKDDELPNQPVQEIDEFSNATQVPLSNRVVTNSEAGCRVSSSPQTQSSPKSLPTKRKLSQDGCEGGDVVFSYPAERSYKTVKSTLFNDGISSKKGSVVVSRLPSHKKTRKRSPKKTVVYYYKVKKEDGSDAEFDNRQASWQETAALQTVPRHEQAAFRKTSSNYSAECKDVNSPGNLAGGVHYAQRAQSKGGEKSSRFEYQNNAPHGNCGTGSGEYPNEPRDVPSSLQSASKNVGLDRVKIVEIHTVGKKMDIVYSDKPGDAPKQVSENRPVEQYHCSKNPTTSLPTSVAAPHYVQREEQATAAEKPPVQVSATGTTPVVHYLPVYAIPSSSGVQYQAVPGAAILEKVPGSSNLYSPVQKSNAVSSQPAYQPQTPSTVAQQPQAQPVVSRIPQPQPHHARPQLQPHPQPPSHPQVPQQQPQGPVMYRPRMIANQANSQPSQLPVGPSAYPAQQGHHPMATLPYPPQDPRIMQPQAYPPQTVPQPVSTPSYVVAKTEPMPPQQLSPPGHPVVVSQPYIVTDQARHLLPSTHYPVQTQGLRGQPPYPPQDQKVSRVPHYPLPYEAVQTQPSYPVHIVPVAVPHAPVMAQHLPANQPAPPASSASVVTIPQQYSSTPPSQPFYPAQSSAVQYVPEKSSSVPPVHYYPAEKPAAQAVPQYQGEKPASAQSLPYPVENPNQPLTPQYTPNPTDQQQKFTYAPPPPDFMYSPVYRVPVTTATETSQPPKGAKRRKTAMPHRETRDILTPPESYMEQPSKDSMLVQGHETASKSPGQNPVLNKSSCVITPPGSPQDEQDGSYTVVMRDYGIQAGPQATQTQSSTEQGMWEVKVKEDAPRVYVSEREALADKYDDGATYCEEEDDDEEEDESDPDDDDDSQYSPTQKENMSPKDDFLDDDKTVHNSSRKGWRRHMKYTCRFCHKGFQWHSHLLSHERTHTGEKPFKCSECARAFTRADGLQCHMLVHNRKRPFKCQYCSKGFNDNTTLEKHIYSHTGVKPFKCEYCGRAFSDSQSIEKHLLVHVGTKPYKCQFCVRSFNDSQMLVRHIRSHTGEKPFKCQHCQMAFSKQSALVIHTRVHTGEKPYSCPHCFKCFSISGNLQRHILIHTGERPYQCSKCPKAFNNPSHLSRHISKLHAPQAKGDPSEISNDQNVGTENGASNLVHA